MVAKNASPAVDKLTDPTAPPAETRRTIHRQETGSAGGSTRDPAGAPQGPGDGRTASSRARGARAGGSEKRVSEAGHRERLRRIRRLQELGRHSAGVTHDLSNLLLAALGRIDLARQCLPDEHPARRELDRAGQVLLAGEELTGSVLDYVGARRSASGRIDLTGLVTDSLALLQNIVGDQVMIVTTFSPAARLWVEGDARQLRRVLVNLADNARKAMRHGGRLTIGLRTRPGRAGGSSAPAGTVELSVSDTGHGMSEESLALLLQAGQAGKHDGAPAAGLGLRVVQGIVEDHGGRLTAQSAPGAGAQFTIALPLHSPSGEQAIRLPSGQRRPRVGANVLIITRDDVAREVIRCALRLAGHRVFTMAEARAGLASERRPRGLIRSAILDLDGYDDAAVSAFRRLSGLAGLPGMVVLTGAPELARPRLIPADRLLVKPFAVEMLVRAVAQQLWPKDSEAA